MVTRELQPTSILKHVSVDIISSGSSVTINDDCLSMIELKYERNNPTIMGFLIFSDLQNISERLDLKETKILIYTNDRFNKVFNRYFKVVDIISSLDKMKKVHYMFILQDEISYQLSNIYTTRSFNDSKVSVFKKLLSEYKIDSLISFLKLKSEFEDPGKVESFAIPNNKSIFSFFLEEFFKLGLSFYQTKDGIYVKKFDNILPSKLETLLDTYKYNSTNQLYSYLIYDYKVDPLKNSTAISNPSAKSYYFDINKKSMVAVKDNFESVKSDISMNNNVVNFQRNEGTITNFQNILTSEIQKNETREAYLKTFTVDIVVNGFNKHDINKIYEIEIPGNKNSKKEVNEGNVKSSGKYLCYSLIDKIVGDKFCQKIKLGRADNQK